MFTDLALSGILAFPYLRSRRWDDERGATMVEYGLILALVSVVAIVALTFLGGATKDSFDCSGGAVAGSHPGLLANDASDDFYDRDGDGIKDADEKLVSDCG